MIWDWTWLVLVSAWCWCLPVSGLSPALVVYETVRCSSGLCGLQSSRWHGYNEQVLLNWRWVTSPFHWENLGHSPALIKRSCFTFGLQEYVNIKVWRLFFSFLPIKSAEWTYLLDTFFTLSYLVTHVPCRTDEIRIDIADRLSGWLTAS